MTCPVGYTQTADGAANNFVACCNAVNCYADWHTCIDYGGNGCPYPSICSSVYGAYTSWYALSYSLSITLSVPINSRTEADE